MVRTVFRGIDGPGSERRAARDAARVLKRGGVVVFPTETVYGVAADPAKRSALRRLKRIKGRAAAKRRNDGSKDGSSHGLQTSWAQARWRNRSFQMT